MNWGKYDHTVLVLQGGGALGAYQAGVYEGLAESGAASDWVAGVSIGAINAALIAGNPPERRVERLREFWHRVSAQLPFMPPASILGLAGCSNAGMRPKANSAPALASAHWGMGKSMRAP
jgi:predicted acylesterase/phospholipase RssA